MALGWLRMVAPNTGRATRSNEVIEGEIIEKCYIFVTQLWCQKLQNP